MPLSLGLLLLFHEKVSFLGIKAGSVARSTIFLLLAVIFDALQTSGYSWAGYGTIISMWAMFSSIGVFAGTLYYCPEAKTLREVVSKLKNYHSYALYNTIIVAWMVLGLATPDLYQYTTIVLLAAIAIYPTRLFLLARRRANISKVKEMLTVLAVTWVLFVTIAPFLFALGASSAILGVSLSYGWEMGFFLASILFFLMSRAVLDPTGLTRAWTAMLVPETMIKMGQRYLVIHDSGPKIQSFLVSSFKNLIGAGARIVVKASAESFLLADVIESDERFSKWIEDGRLSGFPFKTFTPREGIGERLGLGPVSTVYVTELEGTRPLGDEPGVQSGEKESSNVSELFLLENTNAPRSRVAEFMRRNRDIQLLDLSEHASPFSSLARLDHSRLQGSTILLEYDSSASYEEVVDKFLAEGIANAELSVLFTSKSSKLYRAIKGRKTVKLIAASSLVSAPDELPDGEVQIPDKELGLVTSIASDFLENNRDLAVSFVFDSLTELIRGDRWEQIYSGVKQMVEMLAVPNATALFLVDQESFEPRFLGALRGLFSVQMSLAGTGLQVIKLATA